MNKYVVTYRTLALRNSEVELREGDPDKMREEIRTKKQHEAMVFGRDWEWTEVVRDVVIEADFYSINAGGTALFYVSPQASSPLDFKPELIVSISQPVTIAIQGKGSGGIGKVPWTSWNPESSGGAGLIGWTTPSPDPASKPPVTHALPLSYDELTLLRQGLKELDPAGETAVDSMLDAKLYAAQVIVRHRAQSDLADDTLELDAAAETIKRRVGTLTTRHRGVDGKVYRHNIKVSDRDYEYTIDFAGTARTAD